MKTCEERDKDLALYVEGDLPPRALETLERHLGECATCQALLRDLEASQRSLKDLAGEPLPVDALAAVRTRVLAEARREPARFRAAPTWAWATAAAGAVLLALALGVLWSGRPSSRRLPVADVTESMPARTGELPVPRPHRGLATPTVPGRPDATGSTGAIAPREVDESRPVPGPRGAAATPPSPVSTLRPSGPVYGSEDSSAAAAAARLTPEEADQLARALVALSRLEGLASQSDIGDEEETGVAAGDPGHGGNQEGTERSRGPLVRWTTADPEIVIYWQLDINGGES